MNSETLFNKAKQFIPGGVNSPVRSFNGVGGTPPFIKRGEGAYIYDEDGNKYIDYVASWGPLIVGHAHPSIISAIKNAAENGTSFGATTAIEVELAELICQLMPAIEMVRMVNSGTEATMSAIRLARGYTGRDKILKFIGCYHGHADSLLVKAGSGLLTFGIPSCQGVPAEFVKHTLTASFNNLTEVEEIFAKYGEQIAAIIVEPVACNMNCILPTKEFLQGLRKICDQYRSVLIFDEVITGFRLGLNGAQGYFGIKPDLTTLGKIIGGGMPVGAYGGSKKIMQQMAPLGAVYQAGTLSGNPLAMAAGLAMLQELMQPKVYQALKQKTDLLVQGLMEAARAADIPFLVQQVESIFGVFFTEAKIVTDYEAVAKCDTQKFAKFFHAMLREGIYLAPSAFEAGFISTAHTEADIARTVEVAAKVLAKI